MCSEVNPGPVASPRKPWVAAVLSVLMLGLGHVYAGRWQRGLVVWVGARAAEFLIVALMSMAQAGSILDIGGLGIASLTAAVVIDAMNCAHQGGAAFILRDSNRWYVYVAIFVINATLLQPSFGKLLRTRVDAFRIPSTAMRPTLLPGDRFVATRLAGPPLRQEVVVYRHDGLTLVKRIVGMPGDTLAMEAGTLIVDGKALSEPYAIRLTHDENVSPDFRWQTRYLARGASREPYRPTQATWGPLVVPDGAYFILGDNRDDSYDSRYTGFILRDSIRMRVRVVYLSLDPDTKLPRWGRIGRSVR